MGLRDAGGRHWHPATWLSQMLDVIGTLVPVIGLVQIGNQWRSDRYSYLPLIGLFILVAWGASDLLSRWRHSRRALAVDPDARLARQAGQHELALRAEARARAYRAD